MVHVTTWWTALTVAGIVLAVLIHRLLTERGRKMLEATGMALLSRPTVSFPAAAPRASRPGQTGKRLPWPVSIMSGARTPKL
jgi:hypothetical protein